MRKDIIFVSKITFMKNLLLAFLIFFCITSVAQDVIYKKNGSTIYCKVNEITIDLVKYKRLDIRNSPSFEIKKEDLWKVKYKNGVTDIFNQAEIKPDSILCERKGTEDYSMFYVVFNSGQSDQYFPFYFNDKYICKLKNHSRLLLKIKDEGDFYFCRNNNRKIGPVIKVSICNGNTYGIRITVPYPQGLDPNKRFAMDVINSDEVQSFIENEYNGFKPFPALDFSIELK